MIEEQAEFPLGHVLESTRDNKLNNSVCPHCRKWQGVKNLKEHMKGCTRT